MKEQILCYLLTIPRGRVVTYGQIAAHLGNPRLARVVGNILHTNPDGEEYPCYKVVNRDGRLSAHYAFGGMAAQRERLEREGIVVRDGRVDLAAYGLTDTTPNAPKDDLSHYPRERSDRTVRSAAKDTPMTHLDERLIYTILSAVEEIPVGRVATYGQIAALIGKDRNARLVGRVLSMADRYGDYPCHRVVNAQGRTTPGWPEQRILLENEGVTFRPNGHVDLTAHRWQGD